MQIGPPKNQFEIPDSVSQREALTEIFLLGTPELITLVCDHGNDKLSENDLIILKYLQSALCNAPMYPGQKNEDPPFEIEFKLEDGTMLQSSLEYEYEKDIDLLTLKGYVDTVDDYTGLRDMLYGETHISVRVEGTLTDLYTEQMRIKQYLPTTTIDAKYTINGVRGNIDLAIHTAPEGITSSELANRLIPKGVYRTEPDIEEFIQNGGKMEMYYEKPGDGIVRMTKQTLYDLGMHQIHKVHGRGTALRIFYKNYNEAEMGSRPQ